MEFTTKFVDQFSYMSRKDINAIINSMWLIISLGALSEEDLRENKAVLNLYVWFKDGLSHKIDEGEPSVEYYEEWKSKYVPTITSFLMSEFEIVCALLFAILFMNSDSEGRSVQMEALVHLDVAYEEKNHRKVDTQKVTKISKLIAEECLDFVHDYRFKSLDELREIGDNLMSGLKDSLKK